MLHESHRIVWHTHITESTELWMPVSPDSAAPGLTGTEDTQVAATLVLFLTPQLLAAGSCTHDVTYKRLVHGIHGGKNIWWVLWTEHKAPRFQRNRGHFSYLYIKSYFVHWHAKNRIPFQIYSTTMYVKSCDITKKFHSGTVIITPSIASAL